MEVAFKGSGRADQHAASWPRRSAGRSSRERSPRAFPASRSRTTCSRSRATSNRRSSADASSAATSACRIRSEISRSSSPTCARAISTSGLLTQTFEVGQHHRQARSRRARARVVRLVADGVRRAARHAQGRQIAASHQRQSGEQPVQRRRRRRWRGAGAAIRRAQVLRRIQLRQTRHHLQIASATCARCRASSPPACGYYIVKGAGLPRIDIVGSQGRVNWNQLLSSISTAEFGGATVQCEARADGLRAVSGQ